MADAFSHINISLFLCFSPVPKYKESQLRRLCQATTRDDVHFDFLFGIDQINRILFICLTRQRDNFFPSKNVNFRHYCSCYCLDRFLSLFLCNSLLLIASVFVLQSKIIFIRKWVAYPIRCNWAINFRSPNEFDKFKYEKKWKKKKYVRFDCNRSVLNEASACIEWAGRARIVIVNKWKCHLICAVYV